MAVKIYLIDRLLPELPILVISFCRIRNLTQPILQPSGYGINNRTNK